LAIATLISGVGGGVVGGGVVGGGVVGGGVVGGGVVGGGVVGVLTEMTETCEISLATVMFVSEVSVKICGPSPCSADPALTHTWTVVPSGMSKRTVKSLTSVIVTPSIVSGRSSTST